MLQAQIDIIDQAGHIDESATASLVQRAQASATRGAVEVTKQLDRLRAQGKIDENGKILAAWPEDMKPGSFTDL